MKEKYLKELKHMIEESLNAHKIANWDSPTARKTIAELLVKKLSLIHISEPTRPY